MAFFHGFGNSSFYSMWLHAILLSYVRELFFLPPQILPAQWKPDFKILLTKPAWTASLTDLPRLERIDTLPASDADSINTLAALPRLERIDTLPASDADSINSLAALPRLERIDTSTNRRLNAKSSLTALPRLERIDTRTTRPSSGSAV